MNQGSDDVPVLAWVSVTPTTLASGKHQIPKRLSCRRFFQTSQYGYSPKGPRALFLICLLSKHLLSILCVSGSELGTWDTAVTKEAKVPVIMGLTMGG